MKNLKLNEWINEKLLKTTRKKGTKYVGHIFIDTVIKILQKHFNAILINGNHMLLQSSTTFCVNKWLMSKLLIIPNN